MNTSPAIGELHSHHEDMMLVHAAQHDMVFENAPATLDIIDTLLAQQWKPDLHKIPALMVFPEMCTTGYTMNAPAALEHADLVLEKMKRLAKQFDCYSVFGVVQEGEHGPENRCLCVTPEAQLLSAYTKIHPFTHTGEDQVYHPGNEIVIWEIAGRRICPMICYDLRFPEIFRKAAQQGVDAFVVIASFPAKRREHWLALLKARAIENQCYVIGVNRCGHDPVAHYSGDSVLYDFQGKTVQKLGDQASILSDVMNFHWQSAYQQQYQFLNDMRWV